MRISLVFSLLVLMKLMSFIGGGLYAQSLISGSVRDKESGEALIGLNVLVRETGGGATTDLDGKYSLRLPAGEYRLQFSYVGYQMQERALSVDGKSEYVLDLDMPLSMADIVIVTEGKYEKKLEESTVSVDVVTPDMIKNNVITALDEAAKKVSGVQMMDGQVNIRGGAGYAFGAGSRVGFLVDGQPLLSAELSDIKWNFVPLENAAQIEVIKGSASVLYGSGSLNGVINVRTAPALKDKPYTSLSVYTGFYNQPSVDSMRWYRFSDAPSELPMFAGVFLAHRSFLTPNLSLVAGLNAHLSNGFIQNFDERRIRGNAHLAYRPSDTTARWIAGIRANAMYHQVFTYFLPRDMQSGAFIPINVSTGDDKYMSISLDPYLTFYDPAGGKNMLNGRWFVISKLRGTADPSVGNNFSLEYQRQQEWAAGWIFTAGVLGQYFHVNSILFNDNSRPEQDRALFTGSNGALYAQVDHRWGKRFTWTAGVRGELFSADTALYFTPPVVRFGASYRLGDDGYLRASFGQGFRFPSLAERFINEPITTFSGFTLSAFPNPDLQPEIGWSSEIAYRQVFRPKSGTFRYYVDAALFWMEYDNMVEFQLGFYPEGLGFKSINIAQSRIAGWEISTLANGKIGNTPLRIWGGYTYSCPANLAADSSLNNVGNYLGFMMRTFAKGIDSDDSENINRLLKYRSLHNVRLDVETEWKKFVFGTSVNYNSFVHGVDMVFTLGILDQFNEFRAERPNGDWVFDARIGYAFSEKSRLNLVVSNLANRVYAFRPARVDAPRTISLKYAYTF